MVENKQLLKSFEVRSNVPRAVFKETRCVEVKQNVSYRRGLCRELNQRWVRGQ